MTPAKFHFTKFRLRDAVYILAYVAISILCWYCIFMESDERAYYVVVAYGLGTQMVLYAVLYKSLRSALAWILWLLVGAFHLYLYFQMKNDFFSGIHSYNATVPLRNTLLMLVLFQLLRMASFNIQGRDLIGSWYRDKRDMYDAYIASKHDVILLLIYYGVMFGLFLIQ